MFYAVLACLGFFNEGSVATIEKRVSSGGAIMYRVKVRLKGHAPETASFARRTDAREWAQRVEADIKAGRHFGISKRHTLAELLDRKRVRRLLLLWFFVLITSVMEFPFRYYFTTPFHTENLTGSCDQSCTCVAS